MYSIASGRAAVCRVHVFISAQFFCMRAVSSGTVRGICEYCVLGVFVSVTGSACFSCVCEMS
jgi:hypothetical protein